MLSRWSELGRRLLSFSLSEAKLGMGPQGSGLYPGILMVAISARLQPGVRSTEVGCDVGFALPRFGESVNFSEHPFLYLHDRNDTT